MMLDPLVMPLTRAVVSPVAATVAIVSALLAHVPPMVVSLTVMLMPWHTVLGPAIGVTGFTITVDTALQPVPSV